MSDHEHDEHDQGDNEPKKAKQGSGKRLNDRQRVDIIQMAENSKISKRQLADKFGVTEAAIRKLLRKKDDFLRRYYDTPEEIRDQRLRGKSTLSLYPPDDPWKQELDWIGFSRMLRDIRRGFHRYPETGYQEFRTQAFIRRFCEQTLHIPGKNIREMASTGLIVDVCYDNATISRSDKRKLPVLAFRADMDALPIEELNDHLPYCSTQKGGQKELRKRKKRKSSTPQTSPDVKMDTPANLLPAPSTITTTTIMAPPAPNAGDDDEEFQISTAAAHMCGHDGHMAMVLGLCVMVVRSAHLLPQDTFVRFLFQPAEEGPGGAMKMIKDGALTDVDEVYGCHNAPFPLYSIHVRPGAVMAHEVEFSIDIHGIGGHGSAPQQCVDPILAGSAVVQALQSVVSRSLSPMDTAVVSVTQFRGGDANNVIPSRVFLGGTIRDFDLQIAEKIKDRVARLVHSTCAAYGATANVHFLDGYAPVINPQVETRQVQQIAMDMGLYVSEEGLPLMAAEDFSYFLQERKGCYFFLGTKEDGDTEKMRALHSNHYDFNDKAIPLGIRLFLGILQSRFKCELYTFEEMQAFQVAMERIMINVTVV
ncbi:metalloprotease family M20D, putative [Phytophthora infestans T30-4]|uniref:Metalloprotease family M20D, putative n=1 Tax=Phytophthora infestans (strain T30-4) TaxID=403677 RepID=D0N6Y4_PHYIT|nr:metalloprotease family M20D, putative [Phytophthora infestans T30-4]EEY53333.1 metalloprotease family M20D, putative [Phytophthora infestans T30-4]|eukprot:XP_002904951.1 metalloprotease family M20D, putative [Phytophthora infestans T30-4]